MADVIFVAVICAFFALCVVYIRWCDRIIGPDDVDPSVTPTIVPATSATSTADRRHVDRRCGMIAVADIDNWIGLGIAGLGVVYLFLVLIHPERF